MTEQNALNTLIVDFNNLDSKNDQIFFGEYSGFQRYDDPAFPSAVKLEESMRNAFWNPNEISMRDDAVKFHLMPTPVQDAMCSIWFYQTLMDSAQNRGLEETISLFVTNPEFEALFKTWGYFEMIHSLSYSHIIRGIFMDSTPVFERNFQNMDIINRVKSEIEQYSDIAAYAEDLAGAEFSEENAKKIIELILTIYALEGIKFYASFLYTYLIHDRYASIPGATRIIKLIAFDELMHTISSTVLLKELRKDPRFSEILESEWFRETAQKHFLKVFNDESNFAKYLRDVLGEFTPISEENTNNFLKYWVDKRLNDIDVDGIFGNFEETPIVRWFNEYGDLNLQNSALQESDSAVYNIGTMVDDM